MNEQASRPTQEEVDRLEQRVRDEVPQVHTLTLTVGLAGQVVIHMLRIHYGHAGDGRGKRHGTRALAMITDWADQRGVTLTASPSPAHLPGEKRTGKRRLRAFYVRAGFRNNRGRRPEYNDSMFREPRTPGQTGR